MPEYELILQLLSVHMTSCLAVNLCCDVTAWQCSSYKSKVQAAILECGFP